MSTIIFEYAAGHTANAHPLAVAARVALEASPIPRFIKMTVGHDGKPIEIPEVESLPESSQEK